MSWGLQEPPPQSHSNLHSGGRRANSSLLSLPSHLFYARASLLIRGRKEKKEILSVPTGTKDPNSGIEFCTSPDSVEARRKTKAGLSDEDFWKYNCSRESVRSLFIWEYIYLAGVRYRAWNAPGNFRIKIYVDASHILLKIPITIFPRYRIGRAPGRREGCAVAEMISLHPLGSNPVGKSWKV